MTTFTTNAWIVEATADGKVLKLENYDLGGACTSSILLKLHSLEAADRMVEAINLAMDPGESVPEWIRTAAKEEDERNG